MTFCIFCDVLLTSETTPEHILLNALGGRKTTRHAICSDHNNQFGATIDKAIADQVASFRNLLQLDSGTGKPPPAQRVENAKGERLVLRSDGTPELVQKPFTVTPCPEGGFNVQINARDEAELAWIIPRVAAMTGMPAEGVWEQVVQNGSGARVSRRAGTVQQKLSVGGEESLRSIAKAALCLIATETGTGSLRAEPFDAVRTFALSGGKEFNETRGTLDPRRLPAADLLEEEFGPLFNLIYVRSNGAGRVVAHFTLYNLVAWQVVLTEAGGPAHVHMALASNPLDPATWSDAIAEELDVPFAWLNSPDQSDVLATTQVRMVKALEVWRERGLSQLASYIVKNAIDPALAADGPGGEGAMTQEIIDEITSELAHHIVDLPLKRPMSPQDIGRTRTKSGPDEGGNA